MSTATATTTTTPTTHKYGTRIRQNSVIRPSARARQSPTPAPTPEMLVFPPPNVILHSEDASSKIFMAIARSFLSVDNCAMTIKDLAEMVLKYGFICQNVSAAGQAITTYIRSHLQRCDQQQDLPLLLRHTLSGTPTDDDLLPALYSRSGGAHCVANSDKRSTNFRRGTMVWYLSKATGAPCPFTRCGINLSEYGENGKVGSILVAKEKKKERREEGCGDKRKRTLPRRGPQASTATPPLSDSDSSDESDMETRPPKVKLTLRLRPSLVSSSGAGRLSIHPRTMQRQDPVSSSDDDDRPQPILPPYPCRSISIPSYTPSFSSQNPNLYFPESVSAALRSSPNPFQRSPSVANSVGSLPPDSEDEDEDYHNTMIGSRHSRQGSSVFQNTAPELDLDVDMDGDSDDAFPRSPSAVYVKQEPVVIVGDGSLLWDDYDYEISDHEQSKVVQVVAEAAEAVKPEEEDDLGLDLWGWNSSWFGSGVGGESEEDVEVVVKQEEVEMLLSLSASSSTPGSEEPLSPISYLSNQFSKQTSIEDRRNSELMWKDAELLGPEGIRPHEFESAWAGSSSTTSTPCAVRVRATTFSPSPQPVASTSTLAPKPLQPDVVVVHTCLPCSPTICATQVEGISVYQMNLGTVTFMRRIDTDFVHLTPIANHLSVDPSRLFSLPNATYISKGSPTVQGTWVPLSTARSFVSYHRQTTLYDLFLSDSLHELFPSALQDFHRSEARNRILNQFGSRFKSTLDASQQPQFSLRTHALLGVSAASEFDSVRQMEDHELSIKASLFSRGRICETPLLMVPPLHPQMALENTPLSATEQEMFHALCGLPEWEKESSQSPVSLFDDIPSPMSSAPPSPVKGESPRAPAVVRPAVPSSTADGKPLRRSKRTTTTAKVVTPAPAPPPRTSSRRRTTRSSSALS